MMQFILPFLFMFIFLGQALAEKDTHQVCCDAVCYETYFVQNREEHRIGLSGSRTLASDEAMLFAYAKPGENSMWMKAMEFPLDMLWLDENKKIVSIQENLKTCPELPCEGYRSSVPASYVLELNAGIVQKDGLMLGRSCRWKGDAAIYKAPSLKTDNQKVELS